MAKEYKTLVFPDTMQGRKQMAAEIDRLAAERLGSEKQRGYPARLVGHQDMSARLPVFATRPSWQERQCDHGDPWKRRGERVVVAVSERQTG